MSIASGERLFASTVSGISLFTQQGGARLFAGKDKVEIQAQDGALEAIARLGIQIISTGQGVEIIAKEGIQLNAGGSQIEIADGVKINTGGKFEAKASEHKFIGPQSIGVDINDLPALEIFNERFQMFLPSGEPLSFVDYKVSNSEKEIFAKSDDVGKTKEIHSKQEEALKLDLLWMDLERSDEAESGVDVDKGESV